MVFSSMIFVFAFLVLNLLTHSLCRSMRAKNICLLVSSLIFYSWASLTFTAILLFDTAVCWFLGLFIQASSGKARKRLLGLCVTILLLVLGTFKYTGFLLENVRLLFGVPEKVPEIVLPLGISFYTFQLISYVADVYRGTVRAQRRFWKLLLYASLFHQCVAGPIVRYGEVAQAIEERHVTTAQTSRGISRFTVGLAKKAVLANACATVANVFFSGDASALAAQSTAGLWISGAAWMMQIYLDFSAYSDMAVGMGLMCGFHYPENFDYPYLSGSITDFWRSWHMTLGNFFRDYVYIPLGGNRRGKARQVLNLFIVWSLTGLWHGASWNYVLWGLYYFVFLVFEKFALGEKLEKIPGLLRHAAVLAVVFFGWILFRFEDMASLGAVLRGLFGLNAGAAGPTMARITFTSNWALLLVSAVACTPLVTNLRLLLKKRGARSGAAMTAYAVVETVHPVLLLLVSAMALVGNSYNPFLYGMF